MTTNARKGLLHSSLILGILGALLVATAIGASAMIPKPGQQTIRDGFIFTDLTGYQSPGGGTNCNAYAPSSTASFSATVRNRFNARDQAMTIEFYKMTVLSTNTCYTEAQLENMVLTGSNSAETLVATTSTPTEHYAFDETHSVGGSFAATCGYYQFDMGQTGTGPFAPRTGYAGPPVSGFLLFNGPQCTTSSGTRVAVPRYPDPTRPRVAEPAPRTWPTPVAVPGRHRSDQRWRCWAACSWWRSGYAPIADSSDSGRRK